MRAAVCSSGLLSCQAGRATSQNNYNSYINNINKNDTIVILPDSLPSLSLLTKRALPSSSLALEVPRGQCNVTKFVVFVF